VKLNDYLAKTDSIVSHPNSMEHMYHVWEKLLQGA
jgi:hypothetical protein